MISEADALPLPGGAVSRASNGFVHEDSLLTVAGLQFGARSFNVTASVGYVKLRQEERGRDDAIRYSTSAEKQISDTMGFTLSAGEEVDGARKDETFILGGIRIGLDGADFLNKDRQNLSLH